MLRNAGRCSGRSATRLVSSHRKEQGGFALYQGTTFSENSVVPEGTRIYLLLHPPLKRWAKIFRPFGAGFAAGLSVPQTLLASAADPAIDPYEPRSNFLAFGTSLNRCAALHPDVRVLGAGVVITTVEPKARHRICFGSTVCVRVAGSLLLLFSWGRALGPAASLMGCSRWRRVARIGDLDTDDLRRIVGAVGAGIARQPRNLLHHVDVLALAEDGVMAVQVRR